MKCISLILPVLLACARLWAAPFPETWAYLMKGEEHLFPSNAPITDVACFSAQINGDGELVGGHDLPPKLPGAAPDTRYHLVITIPWNSTLAHIYLNPELPLRDRIITNILKRAEPYDGLQIDIESIHADDGTAYLNFLAALKRALPRSKTFSVAVMARWAEHKQKHPYDAFDYPFIGKIADRVVVMAYDEHHRTGTPGPIASLDWCRQIHAYALKNIYGGKLIMGIPLYGRSWQTPKTTRAYKNHEIQEELTQKQLKPVRTPFTGGHYRYDETVTIHVHYETLDSIHAKLELYQTPAIQGIAFWRIGQEPARLWKKLGERK